MCCGIYLHCSIFKIYILKKNIYIPYSPAYKGSFWYKKIHWLELENFIWKLSRNTTWTQQKEKNSIKPQPDLNRRKQFLLACNPTRTWKFHLKLTLTRSESDKIIAIDMQPDLILKIPLNFNPIWTWQNYFCQQATWPKP